MRTRALEWGAIAAAALFSVGCEGESSFVVPLGDAGEPDSRYVSVCTTWAQGLCMHAFACGPIVEWTDVDECVARNALRCQLLASDRNVSFDAAVVAACGEPDAADCTGDYGKLCLPPGRGQVGAACVWAQGCESGNCVFTLDPTGVGLSACGVCSPGCEGRCLDSEVCSTPADGGPVCVPLAGPGQHCHGNGCTGLFYCAPNDICEPAATLGEACGDGLSGPPCGGAGLFCDPTSQCSHYALADYGEPCGDVQGETVFCAGFGVCDPMQLVCLQPASDGAICDDTQGLGCLPPAACVGNQCVFPNLSFCGQP